MKAADEKSLPTVLLVDGSQTVRQTVRRYLESDNYRVLTAADGFEALARVVEYQPVLVLADVMMPRLDGYQTCALIKNNADYRQIPVILLCSVDGVFDEARARIVGGDGQLSKPFTRESLLSLVGRHARGSETARRSRPTASNAGASAETSDA